MVNKPQFQLPSDEFMKHAHCIIESVQPGNPIFHIPKGQVTAERIRSFLTPGANVEVYIIPKGTTESIPYSKSNNHKATSDFENSENK